MKKLSFMKSKKFLTNAKKNFVMMMKTKKIKSETTAITQENLEELLIIFVT